MGKGVHSTCKHSITPFSKVNLIFYNIFICDQNSHKHEWENYLSFCKEKMASFAIDLHYKS